MHSIFLWTTSNRLRISCERINYTERHFCHFCHVTARIRLRFTRIFKTKITADFHYFRPTDYNQYCHFNFNLANYAFMKANVPCYRVLKRNSISYLLTVYCRKTWMFDTPIRPMLINVRIQACIATRVCLHNLFTGHLNVVWSLTQSGRLDVCSSPLTLILGCKLSR